MEMIIALQRIDQVTAASRSDIRNTFVSEYSLFYGGPDGSKGCKSIENTAGDEYITNT